MIDVFRLGTNPSALQMPVVCHYTMIDSAIFLIVLAIYTPGLPDILQVTHRF